MGDNQAGQSTSLLILGGITIILCLLLHFVYKIIFGSKKKEGPSITQIDARSEADEVSSEASVVESRSSAKSKKRTTWKGKTEFSHPWLLKNLKGHPGNVLHMDFSANGKFMAATCDETSTTAEAASAAVRRRKPRERRHPPPAPPTSTPQRLSTEELAGALRPHVLSLERMWALGYPVEIESNSCKAVMYINPPRRRRTPPFTAWDVNAPEFVPGCSQGDSGTGSLGSTPRSDSDEEADTVEHVCARCDKMFRMTRDGEYLFEDPCLYHWGRFGANSNFTCCNKIQGSQGCTSARYHVWSGTLPGMNGPHDGYVRARSPRGGIYSLDTEMCYTTAGMELCSIAIVAADGRPVYRALVKPNNRVVDYNTRFSGIRPRDLARATKTLRDVQNDILGFVGTDTILVGHALDNDLRVLKFLHGSVVDTCALFPHDRGFPLRRSLRDLAEEFLGRHVQRGSLGHSPVEDARAAMDLAIHKVHQDMADNARQSGRAPVYEPYEPLVCAD